MTKKQVKLLVGLLLVALIFLLLSCSSDSDDDSGSSTVQTTEESDADTTAPAYQTVVINNGISGSPDLEVNLSLSASDDTGVTGYLASESSTVPEANDSAWVNVSSSTSFSMTTPYTFTGVDGEKTVYVFFKDEAGNISTAASDSVTITSWTDSEEGGMAIATAGSGNMYILRNDGRTFTKLDYSGATIWTRGLDASDDGSLSDIAVDSSENIYLSGTTDGTFDGNTHLGGADIIAVKYNSNGEKQWSAQAGTALRDSSSNHFGGIGIDDAGDVYIAGSTYGSFAGGSTGTEDIFVMKIDDVSGDIIWAKEKDDSDWDWPQRMTTDNEGNSYVTGGGNFEEHYDCNPHLADTVTIKYSSTGAILWTAQIGHCDASKGRGIKTDSSGNVYVAGYTKLSIDGNDFYGGSADFFVVKYNSLGTKQWTDQFGSDSFEYPMSMVIDNSGNFYVIGGASGTFEGNLTNEGGDIFVVKYNSSGTRLWNNQYIGSVEDAVMDKWGGIIIIGFDSLIRINSAGGRTTLAMRKISEASSKPVL
jgi:Beta-propeller repeat